MWLWLQNKNKAKSFWYAPDLLRQSILALINRNEIQGQIEGAVVIHRELKLDRFIL